MSDPELLEQEEAYHKLNAELELKTRQLMKDVEAVMNKQINPKLWAREDYYRGMDDVYNNPCPRARSAYSTYGNKSPVSDSSDPLDYNYKSQAKPINGFSCSKKTTRKKSLQPSSSAIYKKSPLENDDILPASTKGMSSESLVRFLKAKAKLLQEELTNAKREYTLKTDEWRKLHIEVKNLEEDKMKISSDLVLAREKIKKHENTIASLTERLSLRDSENGLLKKQLDLIKHDMKKMNLTSSGSEAKLNKAKEEIEKLKLLLKQSQSNEKEARDKCRAKDEEMLQAVRRLEKQKAELLTGIKKQIYLIDNLKKQKTYIQLDGGAKHLENEFAKFLDWKSDDLK
ncbi:hypothetical protein O3M35_010647 [Rhynocoris fuscipes]|uniref:Uncharacterized protein n=1 Tax=Rhynocoris fuscipes TaxID=488301 RepID=A0AAW1D004_9HEMI